jgi:pleiotropic regulator 1
MPDRYFRNPWMIRKDTYKHLCVYVSSFSHTDHHGHRVFQPQHTIITMSSTLAADSASTSLKRARILYDSGDPAAAFLPRVDPGLRELSLQRRSYGGTVKKTKEQQKNESQAIVVSTVADEHEEEEVGALQNDRKATASTSSVLTRINEHKQKSEQKPAPGGVLVPSLQRSGPGHIPTPAWHAPWKLATVLSSHLGWVRSIAFDPTNSIFATGSADRTIKIWSLPKASVGANDALQLTLTGHVSPVRGLAFSPRHPYLFSCGEDKQVKCWDLETNQVVRHYHGHLSGVFCLKLHPTLDLLITGGRDAVARVWDIRTKTQIHCLSGHENTIGAILTKSTNPQIITGSHDNTIKLWDIVAGKCMTTLTHHYKSIRALAQPSFESTFCSGGADSLKKWVAKDGRFIKSFSGHKAVVNAMAINDDGVLVSGGDDGSMKFWDYATGHNFQSAQAQVQPGSLDAENGIMALEYDMTGTRLVTGESDKTIKIWKQDEDASELSHPVDMTAWRKKCIAESKQRY